MPYNERMKNFENIRAYMRAFYVYGLKSRSEYKQKSPRSYDNERRRMESETGTDVSTAEGTARQSRTACSLFCMAIPLSVNHPTKSYLMMFCLI